MREVIGKHNTAKIFTDVVDDASIAQVKELCDQEFCAGSRIRLMPDIHAGAGCTVRTTMTIKDKVVPNLVGVDIGCGMETVKIKENNLDMVRLDRVIIISDNECNVPSGWGGKPVQVLADEYRRFSGNNIWVHAIDLQGYGTQQFHGANTNIIAGWSEKVLDFIKLAEQGEGTLEKTIEQYTY